MNTPTTQSAEYLRDRIELYERTAGDGRRQFVFYNPGEGHEWLTAGPSSVLDPEEYR